MSEHTVYNIAWVCNSPAPYTDQFFSTLPGALPASIKVYFTRATSGIHYWKPSGPSNFDARVYRRRLGIDWQLVRSVCSDSHTLFVTNSWQDPTTEIVLLYLMAASRPYVIWTDMPILNRKRSLFKRLLRDGFLKVAFERATVVMGTGMPALKVLERMGCPPEKLVNFPYFIDIKSFSPGLQQARCPLVFGSCGRLHREKGYDLALRSLAQAHGRLDCDFRYRIVGEGPENQALRALAADLQIAHKVEFLGWKNPNELPDFYRSIDVLLHPSRIEPYGVSVLEGMASANIVVASDQTASAVDRIRDGVNGFLHCSDDQSALSNLIAHISGLDASGRRMIQRAARDTAELWPNSVGIEIISQILNTFKTPGLPWYSKSESSSMTR